MTRNFADEEKYLAVEGIDNALEVAKVLLKNKYEVFVEYDDCNIYVVHYAEAKYKNLGNASFYRISEDDVRTLELAHDEKADEVDDEAYR